MSISSDLTISVKWNDCAMGQLISIKLVSSNTKCSQKNTDNIGQYDSQTPSVRKRILKILVNLIFDNIGKIQRRGAKFDQLKQQWFLK